MTCLSILKVIITFAVHDNMMEGKCFPPILKYMYHSFSASLKRILIRAISFMEFSERIKHVKEGVFSSF